MPCNCLNIALFSALFFLYKECIYYFKCNLTVILNKHHINYTTHKLHNKQFIVHILRSILLQSFHIISCHENINIVLCSNLFQILVYQGVSKSILFFFPRIMKLKPKLFSDPRLPVSDKVFFNTTQDISLIWF